MAVVAVAAVISLVIRGEGSPLAGALIIGASIVILAGKLAAEGLAWERTLGKPIQRWRTAYITATAAFFSVIIIGSADLVFLMIYWNGVGVYSHYREVSNGSFLMATCAVVFATRLLRRMIARSQASQGSSRDREVLPDEVRVEEWE